VEEADIVEVTIDRETHMLSKTTTLMLLSVALLTKNKVNTVKADMVNKEVIPKSVPETAAEPTEAVATEVKTNMK
jgi:hypothetical protein